MVMDGTLFTFIEKSREILANDQVLPASVLLLAADKQWQRLGSQISKVGEKFQPSSVVVKLSVKNRFVILVKTIVVNDELAKTICPLIIQIDNSYDLAKILDEVESIEMFSLLNDRRDLCLDLSMKTRDDFTHLVLMIFSRYT